MIFSIVAIVIGLALHISVSDWRWIIFAIFMVWAAEAFNTAFEAICDVVSPEYHEGVKTAKDVAAGAVLLISMGAALIGLMTFGPYLMGTELKPLNFPICTS